MESWLRRRKILNKKITDRIHTAEEVTLHTQSSVEVHLRGIKQLLQAVDTLEQSIPNEADDETVDLLLEELNQGRVSLEAVEINLRETLRVNDSQGGNDSTGSGTEQQEGDSRLPPINLPTFTGDVKEWITFKDLFTTNVINKNVANAVKLQYLKGCLRGRAAEVLQYVPITDDNFVKAWQLLTNRFENKRMIIESHLDRILELQPGTNVQTLLDNFQGTYAALEALNLPVHTWDALYGRILLHKMDDSNKEAWNTYYTEKEVPTYQQIVQFLEQQAMRLASKTEFYHVSAKAKTGRNTKPLNCVLCKGDHILGRCDKFKESHNKLQIVKEKRVCFNCLSPGHTQERCKSRTCMHCPKRHHSLLHKELNKEGASTELKSHHVIVQPTAILPTIKLKVLGPNGEIITRALLDTGSHVNIITNHLVNKLQLTRRPTFTKLTGVGGVELGRPKGQCSLTIVSLHNEQQKISLNAIITQKISSKEEQSEENSVTWNNIQLADPDYLKAGPIDLILGAGIYPRILKNGIIEGESANGPVAINTAFGWAIIGPSKGKITTPITHHTVTIQDSLQRFWELEQVKSQEPLSAEDKECNAKYVRDLKRLQDGRYEVSLPFYHEKPKIGASRQIAFVRLMALENRFKKNPELHEEYARIMKEYFDEGHVEPIPDTEIGNDHAYLPHHAVIRHEKTTTKLRIVFDGSAKTANGRSLNDELMAGPKMQEDIFNILLRFRTHKVAIAADIEKMYRNIKLKQKDRDYQRILWRAHPDDTIRDYRLTTVTFGLKAAPFLAMRTLQQLTEDEGKNYPIAAKVAAKNFYVDDILTGAPTIEEAKTLQRELIGMTRAGGFHLRKWISNSREVLKTTPEQQHEHQILNLEDENTKTLGLQWAPLTDEFRFTIKLNVGEKVTKRSILSDISSIFDPLGWLTPVTVKNKIIMQSLWRTNTGWDEEVNEKIKKGWFDQIQELQKLADIRIPRWIKNNVTQPIRLLGFADASEVAYAAVVYTQCSEEGNATHLLAAKSKVAPLKKTTLPRLELCAALLLAKLISSIRKALTVNIEETLCFTDSKITLAWINAEPQRWKTFVANRVAEIQELTPKEKWQYINTKVNPADLATRGSQVGNLKNSHLWWFGPQLQPNESHDPLPSENIPEEHPKYKNNHTVMTVTPQPKEEELFIYKYSSFQKIQRIIAVIFRFYNKIRRRDTPTGPLTVEEIQQAQMHIWKIIQQKHFASVIWNLRGKKKSPTIGPLKALTPILDNKGLLRVGGRLSNANILQDEKHPIILPKEDPITKLLIQHTHIKNKHASGTLLQYLLQREVWIPGIRGAIRSIIHNCVFCTRLKGKIQQQQMGQLPAARVRPSRPFTYCGVDFAGPFSLKPVNSRNARAYKAYLVVFICMTTKATHLELASDLSTKTFIAAFRRMIARRGRPKEMFSDNGRNFIGAHRELKQHIGAAQLDLTNEGVQWKFIPPNAPHFGGLWEAAVKACKTYMVKSIGLQVLTYEEMYTVIIQVEAILNSRPLCPLSTDPDSLEVLTPGHFLIGEALLALPDEELGTTPRNRLQRWQLVQQITQQTWKRWSDYYLRTLITRQKWHTKQPNLKVGELVTLKEEHTPPLHWAMGRVQHTHQGKDGLIRVVTVKTNNGTYKRPISKVCKLPMEDIWEKGQEDKTAKENSQQSQLQQANPDIEASNSEKKQIRPKEHEM